MNRSEKSGRVPIPVRDRDGNLRKDGRLGSHGRNLVRCFTEGDLARVQWTEQGRRKTESYPNTKPGKEDAAGYALGTYERLTHKVPTDTAPLTVRKMWEAYWLAESPALRDKTRIDYKSRWRHFEFFIGAHTLAPSLTLERLDEYRAALTKQGRVINQVALHVSAVKRVYRWAMSRDLIPPSKVPTYRFKMKRGEQRAAVAEYRAEECARILAHWSAESRLTWRPFVATVLFAYAGPRANAALSLEWRDVDFEKREIHWRAETDKLGKERRQPMPEPVAAALTVALKWRERLGYEGPYVFPGGIFATRGEVRELAAWEARKREARGALPKPLEVCDKHWGYPAYVCALRVAEEAAGVPHVHGRGAHGWRRMAAGNAHEMTGSIKDALDWIGDTDLRMGQKYLLGRNDRMMALAASVGGEVSPLSSAINLQSDSVEVLGEATSSPLAALNPKKMRRL